MRGAACKSRGAGGSQHKALETPQVTFSSSRTHRSPGGPGTARAGPRSWSSPEDSGLWGGPTLANSPPPHPRPEPCFAHCGGFWPSSRRSSRPGPCRPACARCHLEASSEPGGRAPFPRKNPSHEAAGLPGAQCEPHRHSQHKFRGEGLYPPSEVPQGRGVGAPPGQSVA